MTKIIYSELYKVKAITCIIFVFMLLSASFVVQPVAASGQTSQPPIIPTPNPGTYENISVQVAHRIIARSFLNPVLILDVRYQCEYETGHLCDAVLIPYDALQSRINELQAYRDWTIIVYCRRGQRSQIACETLAACNFTKVHNMLGGIVAWIEAGYRILTTEHYVTVNVLDDEILLHVEPLLLNQVLPVPCGQNQTCDSCSRPVNVTSTLVESRENYTKTLLEYDVNGTISDIIVERTLLWDYAECAGRVNRTLGFALIRITAEESLKQFYVLSYNARTPEYKLALVTTLNLLNSETYNESFTIMNFGTVEKASLKTLESVDINSTICLAQLYKILSQVADRMGKMYVLSRDENLTSLAHPYYFAGEEAKHLSNIVAMRLSLYGHEIVYSSAVLADGPLGPPVLEGGGGGGGNPSECTIGCFGNAFISCFGPVDELSNACLFGCALASLGCGPAMPACIAACITACGIIDIVAAVVCVIYALGVCCL